MTRAFILVLDSLGIGGAADAAAHGDEGADTLGHIAAWRVAQGRPLRIPTLERLGLGAAAWRATGQWPAGLDRRDGFEGGFASAQEASRGKDTPSGHWEMCGVPVPFDWHVFPREVPCFPRPQMQAWMAAAGLEGVLGECHASGTEIIAELGDEQVRSGRPIVYTSADSVVQVAAHEEAFGLARLLHVCELAFAQFAPLNVARVIARPFVGTSGQYRRTANRKDYAIEPPGRTLLDLAREATHEVIALGKIGDIFAHRGISQEVKAPDNAALAQRLIEQADAAPDGAIVFANFVDFDSSFGHRRDVAGYADALEALDPALEVLRTRLRPGDLVAITADHGCDPTWRGTDHTREQVPVLLSGPGVAAADHGVRDTFADLGQTIARHLGLGALDHGVAIR